MLQSRLSPIVKSLVDTVVADQLGVDANTDTLFLDETAAVMMGKIQNMPVYLKGSMSVLTLVFDRAAMLQGGVRFYKLPLQKRKKILRQWRKAPVSVLRDFTMFYEKMAVFSYYCHVEENGGL